MNTSKRYSPEVQERAVRLVFEHEEAHRDEYGVENAYDKTRPEGIVDLVGPTGSLPEWKA